MASRQRDFALRGSPPRNNNNADSSKAPPPPQFPSNPNVFDHPVTRVAASTDTDTWRRNQIGDRHDSPLDRKPKSQRVSPSTKQPKAVAVPPLSLAPAYAAAVQPPRTPQGRASYATFSRERGLTAAQRVRVELSGSRAASGSRANSSEDVFAARSPVYDEKKNGPRSCPSAFTDEEANQTPGRRRQPRNTELIVSKLLPTRDSVNSLLTYLHELQISEASLRKQLLKTKQHTEEELCESLSKLNELQRTMHEVERDRRIAQQRLEEKERRIRELAEKLAKAEATQGRSSPTHSSVSSFEGPSVIAEEVTSYREAQPRTATPDPQIPVQESKGSEVSTGKVPTLTLDALQPTTPLKLSPAPPLHPQRQQTIEDQSTQFGVLSPRSPHRPLWDPWASGGATPMKNLPPVFTIGSTGLDPMITSSSSPEQFPSTIENDYELRSVLLSPHRVRYQVQASDNDVPTQQTEQTPSTASASAHQEADAFKSQDQAPVFDVDATLLSPPYSQQQDRTPDTPDATFDSPLDEQMSLLELPLPVDPLLQIGAMPPIHESPYEYQSQSGTPTANDVGCVGKAEWSSLDQEEVQGSGVLPLQEKMPLNSSTPDIQESSEMANKDGVSPPLLDAPPISKTQSPKAVSPVNKMTKTEPVEPVSLETLLVDFFTEVDKKRLKMAKVYGKRYAGREKWLFAELTKRYGAAKVGALKTRFETGSTSGASDSNTSSSDANNGLNTTKSSDASDHQKPGRQGHPRHPQFFHPPSPASNVDLSANMPPVPPPVVLPPENDTPDSQTPETANGTETPPSPSGKMSPGRGARVSPRQRRSGGNIPPFSGPPPPSFSMGQDANEGTESTPAAVDVPPAINGLPPPAQRKEPMGQFNRPAPSSLGGMDNNPPTMGLRQRHNASGAAAQSQNNSVAETPAVTLEGLLKELYKKHQPDKLKNVPIVAKQYAGKERELVGLLKGKYGALSVKPLEENLEVLERAHRARMGSKNAGKKRGCFVRTMSLVFWLSVLLYFSLGAVFVSFVVLDAWECHALDNDEQELESTEECTPLKKELETFTYERVGDYVVQSHPEACFCSEWKARESALLTNLSGADLVNLARMVPFSPDSFGAPWIASVKEQVPSQEFYDSYAKPVVDVSLDVGSFVWSSVMELAGLDEASEEMSAVISDVVENDTAGVASADDEGELNTLIDSLEEMYGETETEGFVGEAEFVGERDGDTEVEAAVIPDPSDQPPIEGENDRFQNELQAQEHGSSATTYDASVVVIEDVVVLAGEKAATEDNVSFGSEDGKVEEHATVDSPIDELGSEVDPLMEETEVSFDVSENEPVHLVDAEIEDVLSENDGLESSSVEEAAEIAVVGHVDGAADIIDSDSSAESGEVVEMEVRQEGLDLSYQETVAEQTEDVSVAPSGDVSIESAESLSTDLNEETHAGLGDDDEEGSAASGDVGECEVELDDVSLDETEKEAELATNAPEEDEPSESDVTVAESEVSAPGEVPELEVESVDEESANPVNLETEAASDDYRETTPSEVLESVAEEVGGESSVRFDMEASVPEPESETVPDFEVYDDVGNSIDFVPGEEGMPPDNNAIDNALDEKPIVTDTDADAAGTSDIAEEETVFEASSTSSSSEEAAVNEDAVVNEEAVLDENAIEDEEAVVAEVGEDRGEDIEADVGSVAADAVEGRDSVEAPGKEASDLNEDIAAPVEVGTIAEESEAAAPEYDEAEEFRDNAKEDAEEVEGDAKLTKPMPVEAGQSVTDHDLVSDLVGESMTIEATEMSDEKVAASTDPAEWSGDQLESHETVSASEEFTVAADANDTEVADGQGSFESAQVLKRTDEVEENEDEEIAFMEELEDPEEVLRLAEQAAAAELLSLETR
ncbi:hypothetical protein PF005_g3505 [Phytophthora fragariae]|uniref:Uncharacterized protein n=1 Tax=Phytophthora fragariae TaxID=53985 RepID=A0A6A3FKB6_9STRA|nr:hypothetical protein PF003_g37857 [Phytophthora fragariae]KAE8946494.1 hypothetical protein PF009_g3881 [Phytophthora fragariae]KAE9133129.1 hypothetical protein PF007_g3474 [Phytophthora fragariae]KAE9152817.1 hypothetical protein PF006_g3007 [Phytophthora fragariae]KAE9230333.1 hypothetical protein PF005_g3505 [Phytophthora fragariae]